MSKSSSEKRYKGIPVSDGIAIGTLLLAQDDFQETVPEFEIPHSAIDEEISRYRGAITSSRQDLHELQKYLVREGSSDAMSIIDAHIQMLDDPLMTTNVEEKIRVMLKNTEAVFHSVIGDYENKFSKISDHFFQQRLVDVKDLSKRIMKNLYSEEKSEKIDIFSEKCIVFSKELSPSDAAAVIENHITAFVTTYGGKTSHAAIIAQSKGIPYVIVDIDFHGLSKHGQVAVIVDGTSGDVIVDPSPETLAKYQKLQAILAKKYIRFVDEENLDVQTKDGCKIEVLANIERLDDLKKLKTHRAAGVGLFRSEFLIENDLYQFQENEQFEKYKQVLEVADGLPVVIRIFDVGGDKGESSFFREGKNPALGCRAIRLLLNNKEIFRRQIRALLRASIYGDLRILIPLVSDVSEIIETRQFVEEVKEELERSGHVPIKNIPLGSMIEVPSAALTADLIAKESDFISLGTNDLIQYTLAVDRQNQNVQSYYKPSHPSVLRLIKRVIVDAGKQKRSLGVCGELASNPYFTPLLLGMGIRQFSCAPKMIPIIKNMIRRESLETAKILAYEVFNMNDAKKIYDHLIMHYEKTEATLFL
ncbi:MAG: phosphoenolpyruvate--protein phosphotransferase [Simkaniaceae bacterium]|nr:phosphoenolpyruvate--protein phosphotransferase [Simkaniaceae bacterium]